MKPIIELVPLLDTLCATKEWRGSGLLLRTGDLVSLPPQFVPPDNSGSVPWNRVLKNNFWNGSHVFEWTDAAKSALQPLFDAPPRLQELSESVRRFVPVGLASLSDRLGNIVVQLPVTVLIAKFAELRESGDFQLSLTWHVKAISRVLRASCTMNYDDAIPAFSSIGAQETETLLPMHDGPGLHCATLWDDENHILLAATGDMSFIRTIVMNMHVLDPEPRVFSVPDGKGGELLVRFNLTPMPIRNVIGETATGAAGEWTQRRMYREETDRLRAELRFVSYKPQHGKSLRPKALEDVRALINRHGEKGVWLWDPYLNAEDVIDTLFYCRFAGTELRGLTAGELPPSEEQARFDGSVSPTTNFSAKQKATFAGLKSNFRGLNLEFRIRTGSAGWAFHDRFLIFPGADRGGLAWSLGTSINSLGKQHHILQRVDDGQRIIDDFKELWSALQRPGHLIWKTHDGR